MRKIMFRIAVMAACVAAATAALADETSQETTSIGGKMYFDITHISADSDGSDTDATGTGVDAKRFYVGIDHKFDDMWSANVTTDFNYVSNDSQTQVYVKKAFVQAKFDKAFILRAGSADLPWVPFVEGLYGYRYLENVLIDRAKFGTSADWGLHAKGDFGGGMVSYAASVVNGAGYKNTSRSKSMDFEGRLSAEPVKGLVIAVGFYSGKLGKDKKNDPAEHTAERFDALVAYKSAQFRAGAEYFSAKNWTQVQSTATDKADGYSGWLSFNFTPQLAAFARYDHVKPSKDLAPDIKDNYWNVGVAYKVRKNIDFALAYKHDKVENGFMKTSNGTIGGNIDGTYNEIGIWSQIVF